MLGRARPALSKPGTLAPRAGMPSPTFLTVRPHRRACRHLHPEAHCRPGRPGGRARWTVRAAKCEGRQWLQVVERNNLQPLFPFGHGCLHKLPLHPIAAPRRPMAGSRRVRDSQRRAASRHAVGQVKHARQWGWERQGAWSLPIPSAPGARRQFGASILAARDLRQASRAWRIALALYFALALRRAAS